MSLFDRLRGADGPRVVFLGIDGVPYDLVDRHPDVFETLHALAADGSGGRIESIVPPESSACWPSLTTGANPGRTGVYGFQDRETDSYGTYIPTGSDVAATRVWDRLERAGRDATVLNVPVTFPPQRNLQRMVSGFLSPSVEEAASSPEVRRTLERFGYRTDVDVKLGHADDKGEFVRNARDTLDARQDVFRHYVEQDDWDLFVGVYMATDRVNHFLYGDYVDDGPYAEAFLEFYATLDAYIGEIRDRLDDDTTLVVASDHGFCRLDYEVNCNQWLVENDWLSYRSDDHSELGDIADDTRAYSLIPGRFYLNLEGREPRGSVPESAFEAVREALIADLERLTGPDGRPVCRRIVKGEDVFDGDHTGIAPDLVVLPTEGYDLKSGFGPKADVFGGSVRNGMHEFDSACLFSSSDQLAVSGANLYDIAPTLLDLLEVEADQSRMDGESLLV